MITIITYKNVDERLTTVTSDAFTLATDSIVFLPDGPIIGFSAVIGNIVIADDDDLAQVRETIRERMAEWHKRNLLDRIRIKEESE